MAVVPQENRVLTQGVNGAPIGWRSKNLPVVINAAGYSAQFDYAPDGRRWRQVSS